MLIFDNISGGNQNFAEGIITSNTATSFTVSSWTAWDNSPGVPSGGVPANGTVNYYVSPAGQTMMCSDCHSILKRKGSDTLERRSSHTLTKADDTSVLQVSVGNWAIDLVF